MAKVGESAPPARRTRCFYCDPTFDMLFRFFMALTLILSAP